jgi:mono/diheme cytochrome c family protein
MKKIAGVTVFILSMLVESFVIAQDTKTQVKHCMGMKHGLMMRCMAVGEEKVQEETVEETKNNRVNAAHEEETLKNEIRQGNPIAADEKSIAQGKIVFSQNCTTCHGMTGQGNGPTAEYLGNRVADLTNPTLKEKSDSELFAKITDGTWPMPAFGFTLGKKDIWNAINYLRTLSGEARDQETTNNQKEK